MRTALIYFWNWLVMPKWPKYRLVHYPWYEEYPYEIQYRSRLFTWKPMCNFRNDYEGLKVNYYNYRFELETNGIAHLETLQERDREARERIRNTRRLKKEGMKVITPGTYGGHNGNRKFDEDAVD